MDERVVRASDKDRQAAVDRLKAAQDEGRLNLHEYDDRLAQAYQAVTYGDLADLFVDLPAQYAITHTPGKTTPVRPGRVAAGEVEEPGFFGALPTAMRVLWTVWLAAVSINLVVWMLVSLSNTELIYFWPMWVIGPAGAGLLGVSIGITAARKSREAARRRRQIERG